MDAGIVVADRVYPVMGGLTGRPIRVRTWRDGDLPKVMEFKPGDGFNKGRRTAIDLAAWHWTGGESSPEQVMRTLQARKLGVELCIPRNGEIWQMCDPWFVDTADISLLNYRSVGIEVILYGFAGFTWADPLRMLRVPFIPKLGRDRETYVAATHGRKITTAKPYPAQMDAMLGLADALSLALNIPREVPPSEFDDRVYPRALLRGEGERFRGHIAHFQATTAKRDIGPWPMQQLRIHFSKGSIA